MSEDKECRAEFEAEFKPETHDGEFWMRKNRNGDYCNPSMQSCWRGWQAAWSRAAKPAVPEVLFGGYEVMQAMSEKAKARTSPQNVADVLDAAVKLIRAAAPPLPVAQGVPDIGAIWEQAICEVEAGIKLAELRPNQIPGLFQILRRNVEAKLAAAPKEPT